MLGGLLYPLGLLVAFGLLPALPMDSLERWHLMRLAFYVTYALVVGYPMSYKAVIVPKYLERACWLVQNTIPVEMILNVQTTYDRTDLPYMVHLTLPDSMEKLENQPYLVADARENTVTTAVRLPSNSQRWCRVFKPSFSMIVGQTERVRIYFDDDEDGPVVILTSNGTLCKAAPYWWE